MLAVPRQVTYADLGGIEDVLSDIRELIEHPLQHPEVSTLRNQVKSVTILTACLPSVTCCSTHAAGRAHLLQHSCTPVTL